MIFFSPFSLLPSQCVTSCKGSNEREWVDEWKMRAVLPQFIKKELLNKLLCLELALAHLHPSHCNISLIVEVEFLWEIHVCYLLAMMILKPCRIGTGLPCASHSSKNVSEGNGWIIHFWQWRKGSKRLSPSICASQVAFVAEALGRVIFMWKLSSQNYWKNEKNSSVSLSRWMSIVKFRNKESSKTAGLNQAS